MAGSSSWTRHGAGLGLLFLTVTMLLKASLRSTGSAVAPGHHVYGRGLHTAPTEYSPLRRWLQEATGNGSEEAEGDDSVVLNPSATIDGYELDTANRTCNFTVNYNTTWSLRELVPAGSAEEGAPADEWVDAAELYLETLDLELVNFTNGTFICDKEFEHMPAWEMVLWLLLLLYLFLALYIICDHHFVPALEVVGNALRWSESVQGATLLAVGSSFPEFVTALVGVIFFPEDNPGPSTNIGSAVFNGCIIIGCSMIFLPRAKGGWKLQPKPFFRDAGAFAIAAVCTYVVYEVWTPKELYWYECLFLSLVYVAYVVTLITTDKCLSPPVSDEEREFIEAATAAAVVGSRASMVVFRRFEPPDPLLNFRRKSDWFRSDSRGTISFGAEKPQSTEVKRRTWSPGDKPTIELDEHTVEIELSDVSPSSSPRLPGEFADMSHAVGSSDIVEVPEKKLKGAEHGGHRGVDAAPNKLKKKRSAGKWMYLILSAPISFSLKITIPQPRALGKCPAGCMTALSCFMSICWLGFITYFVVEIAQDVFLDLGLGAEFLGLTVLAVGSSLPDCLSSIIVARQGRIDMAVSNALGSNVFDFLWCIGFPFMVQSLMAQEAVFVPIGDSFLYLLVSCFVSAGLTIFSVAVGCMRATVYHGVVLVLAYVAFITTYVLLFGIKAAGD
eukprot:INCI17619.10.p1 GENE.INCI17619.10~~INCI17619.10.p1  ORF type:complete len:671 (-),score=105.00 INCI17619.10:1411-3423(-)